MTELGQDVHLPPSSGALFAGGGEWGVEGSRKVTQVFESHTLSVEPVVFIFMRGSGQDECEVVGGWVAPDGTRGDLMANLGS